MVAIALNQDKAHALLGWTQVGGKHHCARSHKELALIQGEGIYLEPGSMTPLFSPAPGRVLCAGRAT